ncbi:DNRLRE domain-containing protein [Bacteroidales bacterium OttesenSCG-928-A17]|nr:DNRLRE domain-containing protein [Bacteroidales bacterium OttesenSCG-928-A17]
MKNTFTQSLILLIALFFSNLALGQVATPAPQEDIYDLIMSRIQEKEKSAAKISTIDSNVSTYLELLYSDGSFSNINYNATDQTNWGPIAHLDRLKSFVLAYTLSGSNYYEDEDIFNKIEAMFSYWHTKDPRSTNWFMQQIAAPQRMGVLLILMRTGKKQIRSTLESDIITRMATIGGAPDQSGSQGTGANKVDIATHWVYRGCLTKNKTVLEKGIQQAFYPLFHTTGEGFQHDYSYLQHGQQLYIGGYGDVIAQGICYLAQYVNGTEYALSDEKFDILFSFMRETYLPVIRGQYFLYNAAGRSLSRPNAMSKSGFGSVIELLKAVDTDNTATYDAAIKRVSGEEPASYGIEPYHAHYWRSDYTIHQRPGFTIDVRTVSTRTLRNENGNGENIKGYFLSEGATDIAVEGNEYYNIFPAWDWGRIPGTTTPALTTIPQPGQWGTAGKSLFVGGVSDGTYGVSTYSMYNYEYSSVNTEAKKSWFFFDDEVVCLGAGIKSTAALQVNTTLDQSLLSGDVTVIKTDNTNEVYTSSEKGSRSFDNNLSWVLHRKVGYYLPEGGKLVVNNQTQSGSWTSINTSQGGTDSKDVFKLWIDHGVKPTNDKYAYVIVPNVNTVEKVGTYNTDNIKILSNTEVLQAVEHAGLGIVGIVFYGPATFQYNENISIRATKGCTVLLKNITSDEITVHVSDPSASLPELSLIVETPSFTETKELKCELPTEKAYAGSTVEYTIDETTPAYVEVIDLNTYIEPAADTYAYGGGKTSNYGNETMIVVKTDSEAYTRTGYLKFDISGVDFSKAEEIKLALTVAEGDETYLNNTMRITACGNSWTETGLNWNNKPATTGSVLATAKAVEIGSTLYFDIKDYILGEIAKGNTTLSFRLDNTYTGAVAKTRISFHSKESLYEDMRPLIVVVPDGDVSIPGITAPNNYLTIYPNPVKQSETVNIHHAGNSQDFSIKISNLTGAKIKETTAQYINTNTLSPGYYIVTVTDEEGNCKNSKLIIK